MGPVWDPGQRHPAGPDEDQGLPGPPRSPRHRHAGVLDQGAGGDPAWGAGANPRFAGAAVFLASEASAMVTGVMLPVDGGNLAMNASAADE